MPKTFNNSEILSLVESLGFGIDQIFKQDDKRGLTIFKVQSGSGKYAVLKIIEKKRSTTALVKNTKKELLVSRFMGRQRTSFSFLASLDFGTTEKYFWLLRDFVEGADLCLSNRAYDELDPKINDHIYISEIANNIIQLWEINISDLPKEIISQKKKVDDNFSACARRLSDQRDYLRIDHNNFTRFINGNSKEYFAEKKCSIGDLNPGNILCKDERVVFFDFEWFCVDNKMIDVAYLWLFLWKRPLWQRTLAAKTIKTRKDEIDFQMSLIRILSIFPWEEKDLLNEKRFARRNNYWSRVLASATFSLCEIEKIH
jgi:hypothetical protein